MKIYDLLQLAKEIEIRECIDAMKRYLQVGENGTYQYDFAKNEEPYIGVMEIDGAMSVPVSKVVLDQDNELRICGIDDSGEVYEIDIDSIIVGHIEFLYETMF